MKKIRITNSQLKKIQESEKDKIHTIKITESQLTKIKERIKAGELETNIDNNFKKEKALNESIEFVDFGREVMQAINDIFNNTSQDGLSPFWVKLGVTKGELAQLIIGGGLVYTTTLVTGEVVYKIARKGLISALKRLYNVIVGRRYDMYNKGKVIGKDLEENDGGYPAGAEYDSNAPFNKEDSEPSEEIPYELVTFADGFAIFEMNGKFYLSDYQSRIYKTEEDVIELFKELYQKIGNKDGWKEEDIFKELSNNEEDIEFLETEILYLMKKGYDEKIISDFKNVLERIKMANEMTTTGSVGGSYETPFFMSKNPKKGRFFNTPMIKGGSMIKGKISEDDKYRLERFAVEMDMYIFAKDIIEAQKVTNQIAKSINKKYDADARVTNLKAKSFGSVSEKSEVKDIAENYYKIFTEKRNTFFDGDLTKILNLVENDLSKLSNILDENITNGIKENLISLLHESNNPELIDIASFINEDYGKVTFDDCVKLNNNTEAQNGGCSTGAVDDVVKIEKKEDK